MAEYSAEQMEQRSKAFLGDVVKNYKIFIDTCSLLSEHADKFWEHILPMLKECQANVVVPFRVYQEVEKYAKDADLCKKNAPDDPELNRRARIAKDIVVSLQSAGLVRVMGDESDNFADNVFLTVFTQYRMKYNLLLITQDKNLATDIMRISESKAVTTKTKIQVRRINKYGYLSFLEIPRSPSESRMGKKESVASRPSPKRVSSDEDSGPIPEDEMFAHSEELCVVKGSITVTHYPEEGDVVAAERGGNSKNIKIVKKVSAGGEGIIYTTDIPNVVAKIYKPGKADRAKYEKLKLMMSKNINCKGVCFPIALLYNSSNEFVGFLMQKAEGKELQRCLFVPQLLKKYFPNWKKKDTVQLCLTILEKLKYLHDRNIILGDINPNNILIVSPTEVYFVDADSYQIEGFPCPVGTINYTAPEIQKKRFDSFLRTLGNEKFAVATLLFMIMLPGKPPYSLQGGENQVENIINGDFAYASGERTTGKAPEGVWRYIWSHLPRYLKDDFYETFRKGGMQSTESTRFSDEDWIRKFEHYAELLADENGRFLTNDSMSAELFPSRLKRDANTTYIKCRLCGRDVDEERTEQGYCRECLRKGESYSCARCGDEIVYTNYQKLIRHSRRYDVCKRCNDKLNSIYRQYRCGNPRCRNTIEITYRYKENLESKGKRLPTYCKDCRDAVYTRNRCSNCGRTFDITFGEKEYFDAKGFDLPKKCQSCRGVRQPTYNSSYNYTSRTPTPVPMPTPQPAPKPTPKPTPEPKKSSFCFITTAVCAYLGKPDDCYELTILRKFRDGWLAQQNNGLDLIQEYYSIAPQIVDAIDASERKDQTYTHLWKDYIKPCITLIELSAYETCKDLYMTMVRELKESFVS